MCGSKGYTALTGDLFGSSLTHATQNALMPKMPDIPQIPIPPGRQDEKLPDPGALRRRRPMPSSTLLTGPTGVSAGALTTGAPTLLGA